MISKTICPQCRVQIGIEYFKNGFLSLCPFCEKEVSLEQPIAGGVNCDSLGETAAFISEEGLELQSGASIGGYVLKRLLGRGGMGEVWLADQGTMKREVALKVFLTNQSDGRYIRYHKEVKILGNLDHPNIVPAYDAGEDNGLCFLSMKYIEGRNLSQEIKTQGIMSEEYALNTLSPVVQALQYAYNEFDMLHRDLKPSNILIDQKGQVFVADMGISKSSLDENSMTLTGEALGTPYYMSPEQADNAADLDCRSDIYSLGITLYEMVTGRVPYDGATTASVLKSHVNVPFPSPKEYNARLSDQCVMLIENMMAKKPANRYQCWADVIHDISLVLTGSYPSVKPVEPRVSLAIMDQGAVYSHDSETVAMAVPTETAAGHMTGGKTVKENAPSLKKKLMYWAVAVCVIVSVLGISFIVWSINGLDTAVNLDEEVNQSWAQVENQLQRRNDLIPNLVNVVKGYMNHEKDLLTKITELRSQWGKARTTSEKIVNANAVGGELSRLLLLIEKYPNLKSDEQCRTLQAQIEGTENRIAVERMRYNHSVQNYNRYSREVVGGIFVRFKGLDDVRLYYKVSEDADCLPVVEL